jgi:hypothetical protein
VNKHIAKELPYTTVKYGGGGHGKEQGKIIAPEKKALAKEDKDIETNKYQRGIKVAVPERPAEYIHIIKIMRL